jgi:hypothetical protein
MGFIAQRPASKALWTLAESNNPLFGSSVPPLATGMMCAASSISVTSMCVTKHFPSKRFSILNLKRGSRSALSIDDFVVRRAPKSVGGSSGAGLSANVFCSGKTP